MSGVASLDNGDRVASVLGTVAGVRILAPVLMQWARSRWPEVGVAMDMMQGVFVPHTRGEWKEVLEMGNASRGGFGTTGK